jgi:hypothetical protein
MFDVHFFVNPSYETSVSFSIKLAVFLAGGWADTWKFGQNYQRP